MESLLLFSIFFWYISTFNQLITIKPELRNKIKTFVAMAPPFAGASKLLDVFLYGSHDFDTEISIFCFDILKVALDSFVQYCL